MKIDPHKHKEKYFRWKERTAAGIPDISPENSQAIKWYISDMENGLNVSSKSVKGARSYVRLNNLQQRMTFLAKKIEQHYHSSILQLTEEQIIMFFNSMRNGTILRKDGKPYRSVVDYINPFKAFWHWHMKVSKKMGNIIPDITQDIDISKEKPQWVYLNHDQIRRLTDNAKHNYKVLITFLYDTGLRSPSELVNIRVSDFYDDFKKLNIREEIVKKGSFGRRINLMLCSELIKQYVTDNNLSGEDCVFQLSQEVTNRYLKRLSKKLFGDGVSLAGDKYCNLTMYDLRHCSCCYWLPRYKSESALKYRFGWKKSEKIHYYSELLGMKDTIREEDMLLDLTKTEIEKRLMKTERENQILKEKITFFNSEVRQIKSLLKEYLGKLKQVEEIRAKSHIIPTVIAPTPHQPQQKSEILTNEVCLV